MGGPFCVAFLTSKLFLLQKNKNVKQGKNSGCELNEASKKLDLILELEGGWLPELEEQQQKMLGDWKWAAA